MQFTEVMVYDFLAFEILNVKKYILYHLRGEIAVYRIWRKPYLFCSVVNQLVLSVSVLHWLHQISAYSKLLTVKLVLLACENTCSIRIHWLKHIKHSAVFTSYNILTVDRKASLLHKTETCGQTHDAKPCLNANN